MVRTVALSLFLLLVPAAQIFAEPPDVVWSRLYRTEWPGECFDMRACTDSGFVLAGTSASCMQIVKADANGNMRWTRTLSFASNDKALIAGQLPGGGYLVSGTSGTSSTVLTVRLSSAGDTLWTHRITASASVRHGIVLDDGLLLTGLSPENLGDMFTARTDSSGSIIWHKNFGGAYYDCAYRPCRTTDGGFLVPG